MDQMIPTSFNQGFTTVVVGGHSPNCRWYSEDAVNLADNIKVKIICKHFGIMQTAKFLLHI